MKLSPSAPLTSDHHVADFDCGEESLNRWLRERGQRSEGRTARSYVVCDEEGRVAGYYCLAAASLARANAPGKIRHNAPDPLLIIVLGRLTVDLRFRGHGIGSGLVLDAMRRTASSRNNIGMRGQQQLSFLTGALR